MPELEILLTQVWNPEVRPLVEEAWRSYNAGAIRASVAATWTAVTADTISKLVFLADEGDPNAVAFRSELAAAQAKGLTQDGVRAMQAIEAGLLAKAVNFELIDPIDERELERIREDRNLCVHPSLRSFSEVYEPPSRSRPHTSGNRPGYAAHPPAYSRRKGDRGIPELHMYPSFVPAIAHIQTTFFDRVRSAARNNIAKIAKIAAKHALRELDLMADCQLPSMPTALQSCSTPSPNATAGWSELPLLLSGNPSRRSTARSSYGLWPG